MRALEDVRSHNPVEDLIAGFVAFLCLIAGLAGALAIVLKAGLAQPLTSPWHWLAVVASFSITAGFVLLVWRIARAIGRLIARLWR